MDIWYKIEWETFDPLFNDGVSIGTDIHSEVTVCGWDRVCKVFMDTIKNNSCHACFVSRVGYSDEPILSYCP